MGQSCDGGAGSALGGDLGRRCGKTFSMKMVWGRPSRDRVPSNPALSYRRCARWLSSRTSRVILLQRKARARRSTCRSNSRPIPLPRWERATVRSCTFTTGRAWNVEKPRKQTATPTGLPCRRPRTVNVAGCRRRPTTSRRLTSSVNGRPIPMGSRANSSRSVTTARACCGLEKSASTKRRPSAYSRAGRRKSRIEFTDLTLPRIGFAGQDETEGTRVGRRFLLRSVR